MKNRVEPELPLIDFKTIREDVERKIRRRRSRSSPSTGSVVKKEELGNDEPTTVPGEKVDMSISYRQRTGDSIEEQSKSSANKHGRRNNEPSGVEELHVDGNRDKSQHEGRGSGENGLVDGEMFDYEGQHSAKIRQRMRKYSSVRKAASKWMHLRSSKREIRQLFKTVEELSLKRLLEDGVVRKKGTMINDVTGILDEDTDGYGTVSKLNKDEANQRIMTKSKELINYFVRLAKNKDHELTVDLDLIEDLLMDGADPNQGDKYGQTVLHEVARVWHPDVAKFFIEHGAAVDSVDNYGRSPLHVASAVDYSEMVVFLLSKGADIHLQTKGEKQTPIHYAAKNDACSSLSTLLRNGALIEDRDFKGRTPLQLGAELDRSEACKVLLSEGAPAGVWDDSGMSCMSLMILKMPPVALEALDQFHIKDRANRKQYFYLNYLEPPRSLPSTGAKSSLKVAVEEQQFSIIMHPVMQRLVEVKWKWFGKIGACLNFAVNLTFCIIWTVMMCTLPRYAKDIHTFPQSIHHIAFEILVALILIYWICSEFHEYRNSVKERDDFIRWRENELTRDIEFCHPRWPEERAYVERELSELADLKPSYLVDWWNYFDWVTYILILVTMICHVIAIAGRLEEALRAEKASGSIMLVFQWTRLMKFLRPFKPIGPFVVILRHVISDTCRFAVLYFIFYIPYAAALWISFGKESVTGYSNFEDLAYNLLQITVVGDFGFSDLASQHGRMARFLCGTYIVVSGIVCLNLFIALLSDTFQRVYDNVQANAQMLRSSRVLNFEDNFSRKRRERFQRRLHHRCSPEISYYDDDMTEASDTDLKRMTHQIKAEVDSVKEYLHEKLGPSEVKTFNERGKEVDFEANQYLEELSLLKREIDILKSNQEHSVKIINMQLMTINSMLADVLKKKKRRASKRGLRTSEHATTSEFVTEPGNVVRVAPISKGDSDSHS